MPTPPLRRPDPAPYFQLSSRKVIKIDFPPLKKRGGAGGGGGAGVWTMIGRHSLKVISDLIIVTVSLKVKKMCYIFFNYF